MDTSTTQDTRLLVQQGTENDGSSETLEFIDATHHKDEFIEAPQRISTNEV